MSKKKPVPPPSGSLLIYESEDGKIKLDVRLERDTLWLTRGDMARLFGCSADNISLHLKNIYQEGELDPEATTEEFSVVRSEGARPCPSVTVRGLSTCLHLRRVPFIISHSTANGDFP